MKYQRAWAEINLKHLTHNLGEIRRHITGDTAIIGIVKADAYGHGAVPVANALIADGVRSLGVATCEEGVQLREKGITVPVLVMGFTPEPLLPYVLEHNLTQTVFCAEGARELAAISARYGKRANIHIEIDTGMRRLGFMPEDVQAICKIAENPHLYLEGIFTHFATSDALAAEFMYEQISRFETLLAELDGRGLHIPIKHAANSGALAQILRHAPCPTPAQLLRHAPCPTPTRHCELDPQSPGFSGSEEIAGQARNDEMVAPAQLLRHTPCPAQLLRNAPCPAPAQQGTSGRDTPSLPPLGGRDKNLLLDAVRPGIMLYGHAPAAEMTATCAPLNLRPVMRLMTQVSMIKKLPAGVGISYGHMYKTERESTIAVLPIGYADGYPRRLSREGRVLINGKFAPIAGAICMDQCMADVTDIPGVKPGDPVVMLDTSYNKISAECLADTVGTISYEILCGIGKRVQRQYC